MPTVRTIIVVLVIFSAPQLCFAQSTTGQALSGAGTSSCGKYLRHTNDNYVSTLYVTWAQGFLSGMNLANNAFAKKEFVTLPDGDSIKAYLDKYCRDNPLSLPVKGLVALFNKLQNQQS